MAIKKKADERFEILEVKRGRMTFRVVGVTPLICEAMSSKVRQELLLPSKKKNAAEKASTLKHNPYDEYRRSAYRAMDDDAPTRILVPATAFKSALRDVALDIPGAAKTQIGRLTYVTGSYVSVYGEPQLIMSVVRNSDTNHTPDIRTRAILPRWAAEIEITFAQPIMKAKTIADLMAAAGMMRGVGGWRPEKGKGDYGQFMLVGENDEEFNEIVASGGLAVQDAALEEPQCFDSETAELLSWFDAESKRRGFELVS